MDQKTKRSQGTDFKKKINQQQIIANRMSRLESDDLQIDREKEIETKEKLSHF